MSTARRYRMTPSERAGYGPGRWVVQYFDPTARAWLDLPGALTVDEVQERLDFYRSGAHETTGAIEEES